MSSADQQHATAEHSAGQMHDQELSENPLGEYLGYFGQRESFLSVTAAVRCVPINVLNVLISVVHFLSSTI